MHIVFKIVLFIVGCIGALHMVGAATGASTRDDGALVLFAAIVWAIVYWPVTLTVVALAVWGMIWWGKGS